MKIDIQAKRTYKYPDSEIYNCILSLPEIVKSFPVIDQVEQSDDDTYKFTFSLNFGMYSGTYTGKLYIADKREHNYLHLKATHQSRLGKLFVDVNVKIHPTTNSKEMEKDHTPPLNQLSIEGYFDVRGMMRYAGGSILKNGVSTGLEMMFDFLEGRLADKKSPI